LNLTQRSLAEDLGIKAGHLALIETGRRKPSLNLASRLADALGLDRQEVLLIIHPGARALLAPVESDKRQKPSLSWQRFAKNRALLTRYHVTRRELHILEDLDLLGMPISTKGFLVILMLIRDIRHRK
jgi:transcriptional regulator with XRE-family HTH domain